MPTTGPYRTQQDFINEVLKKLGVAAAGQPIDPEDSNYVLEDLDGIMRTLAGLEIAYVPDTSNVPSIWFDPLTTIVAGQMAEKFGLTPDDSAKLKQAGLGQPLGSGAAAMALKHINRGRPTYEALRVEYI